MFRRRSCCEQMLSDHHGNQGQAKNVCPPRCCNLHCISAWRPWEEAVSVNSTSYLLSSVSVWVWIVFPFIYPLRDIFQVTIFQYIFPFHRTTALMSISVFVLFNLSTSLLLHLHCSYIAHVSSHTSVSSFIFLYFPTLSCFWNISCRNKFNFKHFSRNWTVFCYGYGRKFLPLPGFALWSLIWCN